MTSEERMHHAHADCTHHTEPGVLCVECATRAAALSNDELLKRYIERGTEIAQLEKKVAERNHYVNANAARVFELEKTVAGLEEKLREKIHDKALRLQEGAGPNAPAFPNWRDAGALGLTKREHFAALAMQGLLADGSLYSDTESARDYIAKRAVAMADTLLVALAPQIVGGCSCGAQFTDRADLIEHANAQDCGEQAP